jgi:DNA-binding NarL/FixJ family response regulator
MRKTVKYSTLIAENSRLLREGIRSLVEQDGRFEVVGQADSSKEAVNKAVQLQPNIALLDLALMGTEAVEQIIRRCANTYVVVLALSATKDFYISVLRLGVDALILKDTSSQELMLALTSVVANQRYIGTAISEVIMNRDLQPVMNKINPDERWNFLTKREQSVFKLIAEGHSNRSAATYLNLSQKTIEKHRSTLMRKLQLNSVVDLTFAAQAYGLINRAAPF